MFDLFAMQIALTRIWLRSCTGLMAFDPAGYGQTLAERVAADDATRELDRIVRAHASARRESAVND